MNYQEYANGKIMISIENENQNMELKRICSEQNILACKLTGKKNSFPIYFCFVEALKTGTIYLVPETNYNELVKNGWQTMSFKEFKLIEERNNK